MRVRHSLVQNLSLQHQKVFVIDFGGQYTQLIVRRVRELGVYSEMIPWTEAAKRLALEKPDALILSGGPSSVLQDGAPTFDFALASGIPVLGICYGMQLMAHQLGGRVSPVADREYGFRTIEGLHGELMCTMENPTVWMSHGDQVEEVPSGFSVTASTETCPIAAFENSEMKWYGVQFHPEVTHSPSGFAMLRQFITVISKLEGDWTPKSFVAESIRAIRDQVGDKKVLCAVSGGVDSSVVAALLCESIGDQLTCVFINHGLLRKFEAEQVETQFSTHFKPKLVVIDARKQFFGELAGITDPEQKRKIIGAEFVRCFEDHSDDLSGCDFLAQGTLYPDVIESGSATAAKIKTHHNVGGLPDWMRLEVIEPLRWLFKDEVRAVGRELGLPEEMVGREPFPGPGLAVRIIGEVTPDRVEIVQNADWIFREEIRKAGHHKLGIWQSYAALLDIRSVGVMGDERTYQHPIVLRAVCSEDAMTATAYPFDFAFLELVSRRIVNEVKGVNRVFYDLTSKPPATIELE